MSTVPYLPYEAVLGGADHASIESFIGSLIGPIVRWDEQQGTDLVATLNRYLDEDSSPTRAARALGVHTNTVQRRLDRIDVLLGDDWKQGDKRFRVALAARRELRLSGREAIHSQPLLFHEGGVSSWGHDQDCSVPGALRRQLAPLGRSSIFVGASVCRVMPAPG